jgi:hypothetical protein
MTRILLRAIVASAILFSLATARPARAQTRPASDNDVPEVHPHRLILTIIDKETRKPLVGVKVRYIGDDGPKRFGGRGETDAAGAYEFRLPTNKLTYLGYAIRMTGYIPMAMRWRGTVPAAYTLEMERGQVIGGTVVDDAGQPVVGAKVILRVGRDTGQPNALFDTVDDRVTTGDGGAWTYDRAPAGFTTAWVGAADPRFISGDAASLADVKPDDALAKRVVLKLKRGLTFYGKVVDDKGHPLEGVAVRIYGPVGATMPSNLAATLGDANNKSDRGGSFQATIVPNQGRRLVLTFEGFAPEQIEPAAAGVAGDATDPTEIVLRPSQALRVKFTDPAGRPVPKAWVIVRSWRGIAYPQLIEADADGQAKWPSAPTDEVQADIGGPGFQAQTGVRLKASKEVQTITLTPTSP